MNTQLNSTQLNRTRTRLSSLLILLVSFMGASSAWCDLKSFSTEAPQVARRGERGPKLVFRDRVVSENSNRPAFMLPPGSSSSAAIRLTAHNIQRSLHLAK